MIEQLVADLPEVYQPIFGHSDLSDHVSRPCADRLDVIVGIYEALQAHLGRPLKVLDLGCAQGYFSLSLASRGASVRGVDFLDKNVDVCSALSDEHSELDAVFEVGRVEDVIDRLESGQYDLVLGLSVFHHVIHERGIDEVKRLFQRAAEMCGALILEIALREGDLYWATSQPEDPMVLLESVHCVREMARCQTHLTSVQRPLYFASNHYWTVEGKAGKFDTWSTESHALAKNTHEGTRRYFFSEREVVKLYRFIGTRAEHNRVEFHREKAFLTSAPLEYPVAEVFASSESESEGWVVMQRFQGDLLLDVLNDPSLDRKKVLREVLDQLTKLELAGLYHSDFRAWNIVVTPDSGARVIDYGAISEDFKDCVWPHNIYLSFMVFVHELATGHVVDPAPIRQITIAPFNLPQPFRSWATGLWVVPVQQWSFRLMLEHLDALSEASADGSAEKTEDLWMQAIEEALGQHSGYIKNLDGKLLGNSYEMEAQLEKVRSRLEQVAEIAFDAQGGVRDFERRAIYSETVAEQQRLQLQEAGFRIQSAERRSQETEIALRESINRATQAELKRLSAEALNDVLRDQARQATNELLELYKGHQQVALQYEMEQQRRIALEDQIKGLEHRAGELEMERDSLRVDAEGAHAQVEYLEGHPRHLGLQVETLTEQLLRSEEHKRHLEADHHFHRARVGELEAQIHALSHRLDAAMTDTHHWWLKAVAHEEHVNALLKSTSWKVTSPLRLCMRAGTWLVKLPFRAVKFVVRSVLMRALRFVLRRPAVHQRLNHVVKKYPRFWGHLRQFAVHRGLVAGPAPQPSTNVQATSATPVEVTVAALSPRVSRVYSELKAVIERKGTY
ncbi:MULTISPECIES: methyltransferase domain-containing protein [Pseudomonas]|uniref:methyltransferase domain-containing protein n=1 Tax=Pseudomonas TaxID=286 RepID=UPI000E6BD7B1|nr:MULTISPECIES: methyltransferase domain-containing protein [Pseudomonas]MBT0624248.1 methyltransferase domain-containing protein [Pseudomonas fluorescens]